MCGGYHDDIQVGEKRHILTTGANPTDEVYLAVFVQFVAVVEVIKVSVAFVGICHFFNIFGGQQLSSVPFSAL